MFAFLVAALIAIKAKGPPESLPSCDVISSSLPWTDCALRVKPLYGPFPVGATSVTFSTSSAQKQVLYDHATKCEAENTWSMGPDFEVLVEGGGYGAIWLETQPFGGAMYACRNLRLALNNQLAFMRAQRQDGRLPGLISKAKSGVGPYAVHPSFSYPGHENTSLLQGVPQMHV